MKMKGDIYFVRWEPEDQRLRDKGELVWAKGRHTAKAFVKEEFEVHRINDIEPSCDLEYIDIRDYGVIVHHSSKPDEIKKPDEIAYNAMGGLE
jgi:hypothetical protein